MAMTTTHSADIVDYDPHGNPMVRVDYSWGMDTRTETMTVGRLLSDGDSNTKLAKNGKAIASRGAKYLTKGLSLAPHKSAGIGNVCAHASRGCIDACLNDTGLGAVFQRIQLARIAKTVAWNSAREWFIERLLREIDLALAQAQRQCKRLAVRLNVFSDIAWDAVLPRVFDAPRADIALYDYTKNPKRVGQLAPNYWTTFSRSEENENECYRVLDAGGNVAVVFARQNCHRSDDGAVPKRWRGYRVVDGDVTDLRFLDPRAKRRARGYVIGLRLKAANNAKRDAAIASGFAV